MNILPPIEGYPQLRRDVGQPLAELYMFTPKGRLISGGSVELQFYPDFYILRARTAVRSPSPSLP